MLRVYACIVQDHDVRLVALAAATCLLSCLVAFQVYGRARASVGWARIAWTATTGIVAGLGTWATHFVAMLAFQPDLPSAYDLKLTLLSFAIAIAVMGCGSLTAASSQRWWGNLAGGALVGSG